MKVTPIEIRQKSFEKTLRGYDKDEVNAFLLSLSQEWERSLDEIKELRIKLEISEREVAKLREVENSLFKTLKTAEDTGANVIGQANKSAELLVREAQLKSEAMLNESRMRAKNTIEEADNTSKQMLAEMEDQLKALTDQYKTFESHRENLLADLKRLAAETIDRVDRATRNSKSFDIEKQVNQGKREARRAVFPNSDYESVTKNLVITRESIMVDSKGGLAEEKTQRSFFDEIQ